MKIIKKVIVKQIITEKSKGKLHRSFSKEIMQLEQECQQLMFEQRKLEQRTHLSREKIKQRFEREIENRKQTIDMIEFKIEQLKKLPIGSEIIEREIDALVEVKEGMNWNEQ